MRVVWQMKEIHLQSVTRMQWFHTCDSRTWLGFYGKFMDQHRTDLWPQPCSFCLLHKLALLLGLADPGHVKQLSLEKALPRHNSSWKFSRADCKCTATTWCVLSLHSCKTNARTFAYQNFENWLKKFWIDLSDSQSWLHMTLTSLTLSSAPSLVAVVVASAWCVFPFRDSLSASNSTRSSRPKESSLWSP